MKSIKKLSAMKVAGPPMKSAKPPSKRAGEVVVAELDDDEEPLGTSPAASATASTAAGEGLSASPDSASAVAGATLSGSPSAASGGQGNPADAAMAAMTSRNAKIIDEFHQYVKIVLDNPMFNDIEHSAPLDITGDLDDESGFQDKFMKEKFDIAMDRTGKYRHVW